MHTIRSVREREREREGGRERGGERGGGARRENRLGIYNNNIIVMLLPTYFSEIGNKCVEYMYSMGYYMDKIQNVVNRLYNYIKGYVHSLWVILQLLPFFFIELCHEYLCAFYCLRNSTTHFCSIASPSRCSVDIFINLSMIQVRHHWGK